MVRVVADSDTRWKWGAALAQRIVPEAIVRGVLFDGPASPTDGQLHDVGAPRVDSIQRAGMAQTVDALAASDTDVVVLACAGGAVQALLHALGTSWAGCAGRPVVVTGYVGMVYERVVDGLVLRAGADLVLANSIADAEVFRTVYRGLGIDPRVIVEAALPYLAGPRDSSDATRGRRPFTVTFAAQPTVPVTRDERRYALAQVLEHAVRHPERQVLLKLRGRLGERTTHPEPHHYASLHDGRLPPNVEVVYGPMSDTLDRTDLLVTVSSTAALEALQRRIPTAVLTDFGVRDVLGNQVFLGAGVLTSWQRLHEGELPEADAQWLARNGIADLDPWDDVVVHIDALLARRSSLPPLQTWLATAGAHAYLPGLLRRYGLDVSGLPADATAPSTALHRRAMRASARRAYRVGVRTIEPKIRRMAQL